MKKLQYFHPFFFALAPAVFLLAHNYDEVFLREALPVFGTLILFVGAILGGCFLILREMNKSSIAASLLLILTLYFRIIFFNSVPFLQSFMRYSYGLAAIFIIIIAVFYWLKKTRRDLLPFSKTLTVVAAVLVGISLFQLGANLYAAQKATAPYRESHKLPTLANDETKLKRDIYYIILDEYSSPLSLEKELGGVENGTEIYAHLRERGFFIPERAKANYGFSTIFSLPSSLNMRYLTEEEILNRKVRVAMTENNFVKDFLKNLGYKYIHLGADSFTFHNQYADENLNMGLTAYQLEVWDMTAFVPFEKLLKTDSFSLKFAALSRRLMQWKRTKFQFDTLANLSKEPYPKFIFAHIMLPHAPFVFDEDGNFISIAEEQSVSSQLGPEEYSKRAYLAQVKYANRQVERIVEEIIKNSDKEPIIIIQADHGWRIGDDWGSDMWFDIFSAYYFPGLTDTGLYDTITPVNSFRILFNKYFGTDFELLEDKIDTLESYRDKFKDIPHP